MRLRLVLLTTALLASACGGGDTEALPTLFPTFENETEEVTAQVVAEQTPEAVAEITESVTPFPTATDTPAPSETPTQQPTATFEPPVTATSGPTADAAATATALVIEAPRFSTLTPLPPGSAVQPTTTPLVAADVLITETQFQEELDLRIAQNPRIQSASINFVAGQNQGIRVNLIAYGGQALTNGMVFIAFQLSGSFVAISITEISVGSGEPPQQYTDIAINELLPAAIETFDAILTQRLGESHDLESLTITETAMEIMLLVPAP